MRWVLFGVLFWVSIITMYTKQSSKNICIEEKVIIQLTFNPGLALTGFRTILYCFQQVNQSWTRDPIKKNQNLVSGQLQQNTRPRWAINLSPRYGHVKLVSGFLVLTGDSWSADIWIFPVVPCHAFCMLHWPIGEDLDSSFIWGHHHLSEYMDISRSTEYLIACYTVLTRPNKVETAFHGYNSWLSVWTLSCRCPVKLFT